MAFAKPCLKCQQLHRNQSICDTCQATIDKQRNKTRIHYKGNYARLAKIVRANAEQCWLCGLGALPNDPWTADHVQPGNPDSPLMPAHRSCNSRRGNDTRTPKP